MKSSLDYNDNILPDTCGSASHKTPGSYIQLSLRRDIYENLRQPQQFLRPSSEADEMFLAIGTLRPLKEYTYIGSHHTDSGLTCVIREGLYKNGEEEGELDWLELVTKTLDNPRDGAIDVTDFPQLDFCATAPEEESALAVYGLREGDGYKGLVLRAWCKAFTENDEL